MKRKISAVLALLMVMMMTSVGLVYLAEPAVGAGDTVTVGPFGGTYYWSLVSVNGGPAAGGWCVDSRTTLSPGTYPVAGMALLGIPQVDWILNEYPSGALSGFSMCDIQNAIWHYTGQGVGSSGCTNPGNYLAVVALADQHASFVPGCGDLQAMRIVPSGQQAIIYPVPKTCNGQIRVTKVATGESAPSFAFAASWDADGFSLMNGQTEGPVTLPTDDDGVPLWVEETPVPAGWTRGLFACRDVAGAVVGGPSADPLNPNRWELTLQTGADITCTYNNTEDPVAGHIIVDKVTDPAGSSQSFEFDPSWPETNFSLTDAGGTHDSGELLPGPYSVAEVNIPSGWSMTGASCVSSIAGKAQTPESIALAAGETVTCTFTNTQRGTIEIEKQTLPDGSGVWFQFSGLNDPDYSDGRLQDDDVASWSVPPGAYPVVETVPEGWDLTGLVCADPTQDSVVSVARKGASVVVAAGETVHCTFTNTQRGRFIVDKVITPQGAPDRQFEFDLPWGDSNLFLGGEGTLQSPMLVPGDYRLDEVNIPPGWESVSRHCTVTLGDGAGQEVLPGVDGKIHLGAGQEITCTFSNFKLPEGSLLIIKDATPSDGTAFDFTCGWDNCVGPGASSFSLSDPGSAFRLFENLETGHYTVSEGALSAGWQFDGVSCVSDGQPVAASVVGQSMTVPVSRYGPGVACTFYNSGYGRIIVEKVTGPADAPAAAFAFDPSWSAANFNLAGGAQTSSIKLLGGVYSVAEILAPEQVAAGWEFASAICDDASSVNAIGVSVNETVTCTFTNLYDPASLIIRKEATPLASPDDTVFRFGGDLGSFELPDGGSKAFSVEPGVELSITEIIPAGWELTEVECTGVARFVPPTGDGDTAVVVVAENGHGECTFHNVEMSILGPTGSLTIIKETDPEGGEGFEFTTSENLSGPFTLDDNGSTVFSELGADAYTVTEAAAEDWEFVSVDCDALDWSDDGPSVTVNLAEGEVAVCTFTNRGGDTQSPGELPYTGPQPFMMPLLIAGLWALLMGLALSVWSLMRRGDKT